MNRLPAVVSRVIVAVATVAALWSASARPRVARAAEPAAACATTGVERIVAVGDVHGAYDRFVGILKTASLVDDRLRWSGGKAHLVQLGDVVDRGPDSRKALDLLQRLEGEAARAGGAVHALLGNHEAMRILGDLRFVTPGEYEQFATQQSDETRRRYVQSATSNPGERETLLKETPLGFLEMRVAFGRDGVYGKWLRTLNAAAKINGILFLHGGISPAVASMTCETINATVRRELTSDLDKTRAAALQSLTAREDGPLWYRGLAQEADSFESEFGQILSKQAARGIVIAHTVVPDGRIRVRFGGRLVQMDTGMQAAYVQGGRASALEITSAGTTAIYEDRRDPLDALH
jgi:hypothetical protein